MQTSRIARKPVKIPAGVEVTIKDGVLLAKGAKGKNEIRIHDYVSLKVENKELSIEPKNDKAKMITGQAKKLFRSIAGTTRANISNIIQGVHQGFERRLTLHGVGYRAQAKPKVLSLSLGFSHPTDFSIPDGITIETPSQTEIVIKGVDRVLVGQVAAEIRKYRGPEPYKGKGIRYANEVIEIKETKKK